MSTDDVDPIEVVRRGYDALSFRYRTDDADAGRYGPWITELLVALGGPKRVLDVGCGCGVPVARDLVAAGHHVTGVDVSERQIERARRLVPDATFLRADATQVQLAPGSFDAIVAFYSIIHIPLHAQPAVLRSLAAALVPDGLLVLTAGRRAWTGSDAQWLGGDTEMWWSQADRDTYRDWIAAAGLTVAREVRARRRHRTYPVLGSTILVEALSGFRPGAFAKPAER